MRRAQLGDLIIAVACVVLAGAALLVIGGLVLAGMLKG